MKISANGALCGLVFSTLMVGSLGGAPPPPEECVDRNNANDCEYDDKCMWTGTGGSKTCSEVVTGPGVTNSTCLTQLIQDDDGDFWSDVAGQACASGYVCTVGNGFQGGTVPYNTPISGICDTTKCGGKKVPGNCNGNNDGGKDGCSEATKRVTICHRTCSAKNPWVRITIDDDAWNGTEASGCGHLRNHDVTVECKNKAPWAEWGTNRKDYLIKWHGTRAQVADALGNSQAAIKAYWRKWEPACPYVRNGLCCNWHIKDETHADYNPCCGINPADVVVPVPAIQVTKYAGPVGMCNDAAFYGGGYVDDVYTVPSADDKWQYCYKVSVPSSSECIYNVKMTDSAPVGGISTEVSVTKPTNGGPPDDDDDAAALCPNEFIFVPGKAIKGLSAPELGYDAVVTGRGISSNKVVEDKDAAGVTPNFLPSVTINKFAGPWDSCPTSSTSPPGFPMEAALYETDSSKKFMYCYYMKNTGNECLVNAKMTDTSGVGGSTYNLKSPFCPNEVVVFGGPPSVSSNGEQCIFASLMGTGQYTGRLVNATDDACVKVPVVTPVYAPNVTFSKFAGPPGHCPVGGVLLPETPMEPVLYTTAADKRYMYCYYIKNVGNECIVDGKMTDPGTGGTPVSLPSPFCPGEVSIIPGPNSTSENGEPCALASIMGTGQLSSKPASADDSACVAVPPPPPTYHPAVTIGKFAGPHGACHTEMTSVPGSPMEPVTYSTASDKEFMFCYYIENTGDECLLDATMTDPAARGGSTKLLPTPFCPGNRTVIAGPEAVSCSFGEVCVDATVMGKGEHSGDMATASDRACVVVPPTPPTYVPNITITKYAGPHGACPIDMTGLPVPPMMPDTYTTGPEKEYMYCYVIRNNGNECLKGVTMTDTAVTPTLNAPVGADFCPGSIFIVAGPETTTESGEECIYASVMGTGKFSLQNVTASDSACVRVPDGPPPPPPLPPTYNPQITISKFAGPPGNCPIDMSSPPGPPMVPDTYTTGPEKEYMYCYYIENTGDECLLSASMTDTAVTPTLNVPLDAEFCPGKVIIIPGPPSTTESGEECIYASVMGTGKFSLKNVTASDSACVRVPDGPPPPTPPICTADMSNPGSQYCPGRQGVVLANILGAPPKLIPNPADMIYNINGVSDGTAVSFKVNSPFPADQTMYIQYYKVASQGGWDQACFSQDTSVCSSTTESLVAGCLHGNGHPFSLVQVYFVDNTTTPPFAGGAAVEECCIGRDNSLPATAKVAQYTFLLRCECPSDMRRLGQRQENIDVEKIISAFSQD